MNKIASFKFPTSKDSSIATTSVIFQPRLGIRLFFTEDTRVKFELENPISNTFDFLISLFCFILNHCRIRYEKENRFGSKNRFA